MGLFKEKIPCPRIPTRWPYADTQILHFAIICKNDQSREKKLFQHMLSVSTKTMKNKVENIRTLYAKLWFNFLKNI